MTAGSIKRDQSRGTWFFVVDLPTAEGGRRQVRRRGFATKKAAQDGLDALRGKAATGGFVESSKLTVGQYLLETWLPSLESTVRPTTRGTYGILTRRHLVPSLGTVQLQKLERAHVRQWVDRLSSTMSAKSVKNVHGVLSKALADAVEMELVTRNVAHKIALPRVERPAPRAWTAEQLAVFLGAVAGDRLAPLWRFLATSACRRGESLGLHWVDVDLGAGTATITHQRTVAAGRLVEGAPKTRSGARTVALDDETVAALRAWKRQQSAERLLMGAGWRDSGLVFTNPDGGGLWPETVTRKFGAIVAELGLPPIGVHGLRHTAATWMIGSGVSPKLVQQRLGHANVAITLGLYSHVLPGHDREAAEGLSAALARASVTKL